MRVLGIDPSLTSTGVALITSDRQITTHRVESAPPKRGRAGKTPPTLLERRERIRSIVDRAANLVLPWQAPVDLAVIEGPSYGSVGAGTWERGWLWGALVDRLALAEVPVAVVPPTVRAKWATGSGSAGKSPVAVHLSRMWPELDAGISDDEWDAVCLASIGAQHLGWLPVDLTRHADQLGKVAWPELVTT
jgi:crossover junction endodeoxyribonuclease RuvC